MRRDGHTLQAIADSLGYAGRQGASEAIKAGLAKTLQEPADELRRIELDRLDALWRPMFKLATSGQQGSHAYVDRCLRIMERRARMEGLDASQGLAVGGLVQHVVSVIGDKDPIQFDARARHEAARLLLLGSVYDEHTPADAVHDPDAFGDSEADNGGRLPPA